MAFNNGINWNWCGMIFEVQGFWLIKLYPVAIAIQSLYAHRIYLISKQLWLAIMIICVSD
jgi:hypothetical protein